MFLDEEVAMRLALPTTTNFTCLPEGGSDYGLSPLGLALARNPF